VAEEQADTSASATLRRHALRPRKSLGQNFLRDRSYLTSIVGALNLSSEDQVLEIGPGTGVLTRALAEQAGRVVAVELDRSLVAALRSELGAESNVEIVEGDALSFDPDKYFSGPYKLAGNIPYYITGPIIRRYLELPSQPRAMVLMVQREVAQRLTARPGDMSLLGLAAQFYADVRAVVRVPRRAFHPAPKVDSTVVLLTPRPTPVPLELRDSFFSLARAGFGSKRKTLGNALSHGLGTTRDEARDLLNRADVDPQRRAETLSLEEWASLTLAYTSADK